MNLKLTFLILSFLLIKTFNPESFGQWTTTAQNIHFAHTGNVGIGNNNPWAKLHLVGTFVSSGQTANLDPAYTGNNLTFLANSGQLLMGWNRTGGDGETDFIANRGPGGSGGFAFYNYSNDNQLSQLMWIKGDGNVGIGTRETSSKLTVAGNIAAREVKVTVNAGADFVFRDDYILKPLQELESFIKINNHLPEIASAKEMESEGMNLSEMNIKLLQKIEELTLYVIEQQKQLTEQGKRIRLLESGL